MRKRNFLLIVCTLIGLVVIAVPAAPDNVERIYTNPIIDIIGPADPAVIKHEGQYYLYPTWDGNGYDVFTSADLVHWENRGKCFTAPQGGAWAPDVFHYVRGDKKFYLYYTVGPLKAKQVGVAVSDSPLGPFEDKGVLVEKAIDAHMFQDDDGKFYLYYVELYETPGNRIRVQPMEDPLHKKGDSSLIVLPLEPWERTDDWIVEGPWMIKHNGAYYLMYSGSGAMGPNYAVGYAKSDSPMGPFIKYSGNPIAKRGDGIFGPGHHSVVEGPKGGLWMVYHQKVDEGRNWKRFLAIDPLWFDGDGVIHVKTTRGTPQPGP
jgi:beta-xylosidase